MLIKGVLEMPKAMRAYPLQPKMKLMPNITIFPIFQIISQYKKQQDDSQIKMNEDLYSRIIRNENTECRYRNEHQISIKTTESTINGIQTISSMDTNSHDHSTDQKFMITKSKKNVYKLIKTVEKLFYCSNFITDDLCLLDSELKIFKEVIIKKFAGDSMKNLALIENKKSRVEILDWANQLIYEHKSTKRVEENNKFVYKYTMKYLKKQFYNINGLKNSKTSEIMFYEHYFKPTSDLLKVQLDDFYDPLYKTLNKNHTYKTINNKYLSLIFTSNHFKNDFFNFLKLDFKKTYNEMIPNKLNKFFKKLKIDMRNIAQKTLVNDNQMDVFAEKLRKNRKCKLPWTYKEISCALAQFTSLIYYY